MVVLLLFFFFNFCNENNFIVMDQTVVMDRVKSCQHPRPTLNHISFYLVTQNLKLHIM